MDLVISFKPGNKGQDYNMLRLAFIQYVKFAKFLTGDFYIIGDYTEKQLEEVTEQIDKISNRIGRKITVLNTKLHTNKDIKLDKFQIIYYQVTAAGRYLQDKKGSVNFLHAHTDVLPIKPLSLDDLNKEYKIKDKDWEKHLNDSFSNKWFSRLQAMSIKHYTEKYGKRDTALMEHHYFYAIDDKILEELVKPENYLNFNYPDVITNYHIFVRNIPLHSCMKRDLITTTFIANQWVYKVSENTKAVNVTVPNHTKSKKLLKLIEKNKIK